MTAPDVLQVLDLLAAARVEVWLDGGWGVDALLGEQTRDHNDLDIVLRHDDVDAFQRVLGAEEFRLVDGGTPQNFVVADAQGREVDVHLVDPEVVRSDEHGVAVYGPRGLAYEVGALEGRGTVLGRPVACCTAEHQLKSHTGYKFDDEDVRDVMALHRRFGLPLPPPYGDVRQTMYWFWTVPLA